MSTKITAGDTLTITVTVDDVKHSDHSYFGEHEILGVTIKDDAVDLPAGLAFMIRRPIDGSTDLRSDDRKQRDEERRIAREEKAAERAAKQRAAEEAKQQPEAAEDLTKLTKAQLVERAKAAGLNPAGAKTKQDLVNVILSGLPKAA